MSRTYNTDPYRIQMLRKVGRRRTRADIHQHRYSAKGAWRSYYPRDMHYLSLSDDDRALDGMYGYGPARPGYGGRWTGMSEWRYQINRARRRTANMMVKTGNDAMIEPDRRDVRWLWE